jgi:hypothetical protein
MDIYLVMVMGRSIWDEAGVAYECRFTTRELAEEYVKYMENEYSDYIDDVIEYETLMTNAYNSNHIQIDVEFDRRHELLVLLTMKFGCIRPEYRISIDRVFDYIPKD